MAQRTAQGFGLLTSGLLAEHYGAGGERWRKARHGVWLLIALSTSMQVLTLSTRSGGGSKLANKL